MIYLSGPVSLGGTSHPDELADFMKVFQFHAIRLRGLGYHVVNPCECEEQQTWEDYMKIHLKSVCDANTVAVLPRWTESRGSRLEVFLAHELGVSVVPVESIEQ